MAYAFKLTATRDLRTPSGGKVVIAKGMSFEHIENSCSTPNSPNVHKTIIQKFGNDVAFGSIGGYFDVVKL